jgi:hypothetical protein
MMRRQDARLARVQKAVDNLPVSQEVLREAYGCFLMFGELPDDNHVAYDVIQRALHGGKEQLPGAYEHHSGTPKVGAYWDRGQLSNGSAPETVRDRLFEEALFEQPPVRRVARAAIALEVAYGGDVASPGFASRHGMPVHGSAGMHVLGYPQKWATPPYEFQAQRLFTRLDVLRARIPQHDSWWLREQTDVVVKFMQTGERPADDLRMEALLAIVELEQLIAHKRGTDVEEAMMLFDSLTRARPQDREQAFQKLSAMAAAGRLA